MPGRFTLLTLSFSLILHNVCSWDVSEPLNHLMNDDGSVSVTCVLYGEDNFKLEPKLKMNNKPICEVLENSQGNDTCKWQKGSKNFTFTLMNPKDLHKNEFSCEISQINPLPITTKCSQKTKLFRGCNNPWAPPKSSCSCSNPTDHPTHICPPETSSEDKYTLLLIYGLVIVAIFLLVYSIILTVLYIRLRAANIESFDTLTYVPMQRNVQRRDVDNTEYEDMREVQKRGGSHRDMNHNSHVITA